MWERIGRDGDALRDHFHCETHSPDMALNALLFFYKTSHKTNRLKETLILFII